MREKNKALPAAVASPPPCGIDLIKAERDRQIAKEGWTADHDDSHSFFEMALAAICYTAAAAGERVYVKRERPTGTSSPAQRVRMLEKAGALIAAEIDRLLRLQGAPEGATPQAEERFVK